MSDANWKLFVDSGERARYEKIFCVEIDDRLMTTDDKRLIVIGSEKGANEVVALLQHASNEVKQEAASKDKEKSACDLQPGFLKRLRDESQRTRQSVVVSAEAWQLFDEYDIPGIVESAYGAYVLADESSSKQVKLALRGRNLDKVEGMLADLPRKLEVQNEVGLWLIAKGPRGVRVKDIRTRSGALVRLSQDRQSVLLVGPSKATLEAKNMIDGLHVKRRRIPRAVRSWLSTPGKGTDCARAMDLDWKFDTCIVTGPREDDSDPAGMVDFVVVGEREENVDGLLAIIDGLHVRHGQIPPAVHAWLGHTSPGAKCVRAADLERKFDTHIATGLLDDVDSPARMMGFAVVGERKENVDQNLAEIANIVVEKVIVTELQAEFLMGHEDQQDRNRPLYKIQDATNTIFTRDADAACFHVAGRQEDLKDAVALIRKSEQIKLKTQEVSLAVGNYVADVRSKFENDDMQIHLRYVGMRPGACELRRLHRVDSAEDDANADEADRQLIKAIDLHEVVLDVHESWARFLVAQSEQIEADEDVGIGVSKDAVNGRQLIHIAGSASTVKRGTEEVISLLTTHRRYRRGDLRLRRIRGQSVDTAGFEEAGPVRKEVLSKCKEPFAWERLTREQWWYVGRSSAEGSESDRRKSNQHQASENA